MSFFTQQSLDFWNGLAENNTKVWFDEHRKDYEQHLRRPYLELAEALVYGLRGREPEYEIDPAKAVYRINRDIRFSKDKTPYKTQLGITVGRNAKHDAAWPGYTTRVGINGVAVAGGLYNPDTELRDRVRRFVGENSKELRSIEAEQAFSETFGDIRGEAHKRAPAELKELAELEPLVLNKQWVFWADYDDPNLLLREDLDQVILDGWAVAGPFMGFLKRAVRTSS